MTQDERKQILSTFLAMAQLYGNEITAPTLKMIGDDLADLPPDRVLGALAAYRNDSRNKRYPLPAQIRAMVTGQLSAADEARDLSALLTALCRKRSDFWTAGIFLNGERKFEGKGSVFYDEFEQAVVSEVGDLGLEVIKRLGGWSHTYQMWNLGNDGTFMAQVRELAESLSRKSLAGKLDSMPSLPQKDELPRLPSHLDEIVNDSRNRMLTHKPD